MPWSRPAKIAFIGSHSVRKSNAVHAFASTVGRAGRSVEVGREVVRFNPVQNRRLTFNPADKSVTIETSVATAQRSLEALHRLRGYQSGFASRTAWAVIVDLVIAAMVFWCLSGLWLWWQLKTTRRLGAMFAVAGLLWFTVFMVKI